MKELYLKLRTDQQNPKQVIEDYICLPAGTELIYSDKPIVFPDCWRDVREKIFEWIDKCSYVEIHYGSVVVGRDDLVNFINTFFPPDTEETK